MEYVQAIEEIAKADALVAAGDLRVNLGQDDHLPQSRFRSRSWQDCLLGRGRRSDGG